MTPTDPREHARTPYDTDRETPPPEPPDRDDILAAVMPALLTTQADGPTAVTDETGHDTVVARSECVVVGLAVAREAFSRLGVRFRPLVDDGAAVAREAVVAEVGGPVAAIHRAAPVALAFLGRLSAIASNVRVADDADPLERYAAAFADRSSSGRADPGRRLSGSTAVDDDGPSFRLGSEE